jgi:hypothetical protein
MGLSGLDPRQTSPPMMANDTPLHQHKRNPTPAELAGIPRLRVFDLEVVR